MKKSKICRGYTNKILTIDFNKNKVEAQDLDPEVRDYFVGGRGLGLYLLYKRINAKTDAYDPENPLIISPGPLSGIPQFPGTSKCMAVTLSPLTKIPGISNFGGHFGPFLRYAGFDVMEIVGKAKQEVIIVIDSLKNQIKIENAPKLDKAFDLERFIIEKFSEIPKTKIAFLTTGIGAKNTAFGCINSHYYDPSKDVFRSKQAGRTGTGSVMIDKNVKAIIILAEMPKGENPFGAADWEKAKKIGRELNKIVISGDAEQLKMNRKGSAGLISFMNLEAYQSLPVKNYQYGHSDEAEKISGVLYEMEIFCHKGNDGCFTGCTLACTKGNWITLDTGEKKGSKVWIDGPEYETAAGFGSNLGIYDPKFIQEANWYCDEYGIDTISVGTIMAFIMECFQRGFLSEEDTGIDLTWGNKKSALEFIHQVANAKTEFAAIAAKGMSPIIDYIIEKKGTGARKDIETFAMQVKGLPFSFYRTHRSVSMQASYSAASDIGAHHAAAWLIKIDLLGAFPTFKQKAEALIWYPRVRLGNDNLGLCKLIWVDVFNKESEKFKGKEDVFINPASQEMYAEFYNAMLGTNYTWKQIFEMTDHDINLQRVINVVKFREKTKEKDWVPDRAIGPTTNALFLAEKEFNEKECERLGIKEDNITEKREKLMLAKKKELRKLLDTYYTERGWNKEGVPKIETLKKLGLWDFLKQETKDIIENLQ